MEARWERSPGGGRKRQRAIHQASVAIALVLTQKSENVHRCRVHDVGAECGNRDVSR